MKKTLSFTLIGVLGLGAAVSTFAFFPNEGDSNVGGGMQGRGFGPMMMFGARDEEGGAGKRLGHREDSIRGLGEKKDALFGSAIQTAITNKDYDAFVKSWNEAQSKITAPTAEDFGVQVAMSKSRKAIDDAISAGNYEAFKSAFKSIPTKSNNTGVTNKTPIIPTQEEFKRIVAQRKSHEVMKNAIENNDYNAFVAARTTNKPVVPSKDEFTKITEKMKSIKDTASKKNRGTKKILRNAIQNK